jgi:hypothetical protein
VTTTPAKPAATRLYVIVETTPTTEDNAASTHPVALIRSTSAAAALKHFVTPKYVAQFAEQEDLYACAKAGIEPVVASEAG